MVVDVKMKTRDAALDIAKGTLIVLMLIGHMEIPNWLREVIYSFHMPAFIFFSGYCFKAKACDDIKACIINLAKTFCVPYLIWAVFYIIMQKEDILFKIKNILCGMSNVDKVLENRTPVGQVYFLLLLLLVRLIYVVIYKCVKDEVVRTIVIVGISLFGAWLGKNGFWLPWSLDCSLYALVYYHMGHLIKKADGVSYVENNRWCYFVLFPIWFVMIALGGMELYPRQYGNYVITILGAVCACVLLYIGCRIVAARFMKTLVNGLVEVGKHTLSILLVHTIFGGYIAIFIVKLFRLLGIGDWMSLIYVLVILLQVVLGIVWGKIYDKACKNIFKY